MPTSRLRPGHDFFAIQLAFWITVIFFGFGPWVALLYGGSKALSLGDSEALLLAYGGVGLFLIGLLMGGKLSAAHRANVSTATTTPFGDSIRSAPCVSSYAVATIYVGIWITRLIIGVQYGMIVSGTQTPDNLAELPYLLVVMKSMIDVFVYGCLLWSNGIIWQNLRTKYVAWSIMVLELGWMFFQGRRWIFAFFIIMAAGFVLCRHQFRWRFAVGGVAVIAFLVMVAFPKFYEFRLGYWHNYERDGAISGIQETLAEMSWNPVHRESQQRYQENMKDRPLIIGFNTDIIEAQRDYGYMCGNAIANSLLWTVPSFLNPNKFKMLRDEENIQVFYHLPQFDTSSNWPAFGCADFGIIGAFLAGVLLGATMGGVERLAGAVIQKSVFFGLCLMGGMVAVATSVEVTPELL